MPYPRVQGSEENPINEHRIKKRNPNPHKLFTAPRCGAKTPLPYARRRYRLGQSQRF